MTDTQQISDQDIRDNSKFSIKVIRYDAMPNYTRVKFSIESKTSGQSSYLSSTVTSEEIQELTEQTQKNIIKAAYIKVKESIKTMAKELEGRCVYLGKEYFGEVETD